MHSVQNGFMVMKKKIHYAARKGFSVSEDQWLV